MSIFSWFRKRKKPDEEELKFFSESEAEYKIPESRKPVVIKKKDTEKRSSRIVKRGKPTSTQDKANFPRKDTAEKSEAKQSSNAGTNIKKDSKATALPSKKVAEAPIKKAESTHEPVDAKPVEEKSARAGSFDIKRSKDGRYVFNLYSANRVIIATSQVYSSSSSAMTGVKSVMANALKAELEDLTLKKPEPKNYPKWEIYLDRAGEYRFRLNASNASCICHAKMGYASKSNCKRAIDSIIRLAENAQIDKSYISDKK